MCRVRNKQQGSNTRASSVHCEPPWGRSRARRDTQTIGQNDNTGGIFVNSERGVGILLRRWVCRGE